MLLNKFLEQSARLYPDKIALVTKDGRYSYREIDEMSNRIANALISGGIKKGDRAAVFMDNSVDAVVSIFGILKAGCVFLMVNPTTKTGKLSYILGNCKASVIISSIDKLAVVSEASERVKSLEWIYLSGKDIPLNGSSKNTLAFEEIFTKGDSSEPSCRAIDVDLASIIYTSGSTGLPKGVMMTHLNMVTAATSITQYLENTKDDIILSALPLSFDYGLYQILMGFKVGATVILERSFVYPQVILERLHQEQATGFPVVPTMAVLLLQMNGLTPGSLPQLRYITNTAATLPPAHIARLRALFPKTRIYSMYGLTECKRVSYLPSEQLDLRPTSVGKAIPNTEVYIVNGQGERVGPGELGELVIRGAHVMRGYWEMPEETNRMLRPGPIPGEMVLYSGDIFRMDEEGYLYFVGRKDDIIKTRGEKVSPKEVESALSILPEIAEVAVIGVPDEILGQAIKALVVLAEGCKLSPNDILRHCAKNLEDFMIPKFIEFRETLPKTATGKIQKRDLDVSAGG